jgi:hypothetical protein
MAATSAGDLTQHARNFNNNKMFAQQHEILLILFKMAWRVKSRKRKNIDKST